MSEDRLERIGEREQFCPECGDSLGYYNQPSPKYDTCGKQECEREMRYAIEAERTERQWRAEEDEYYRY